jgi:N-carbamoyl-L-amino-acid hydrolase
MNIIPKSVEVGIDFRDPSASNLEKGVLMIKKAVDRLCKEQEVDYSFRETARSVPVRMSESIVRTVETSAAKLDAPSKRMVSGAGHDTQNMASICNIGMIFVPSKGGVSHAPEEYTSPGDLTTGADVLLSTIVELAKSSEE